MKLSVGQTCERSLTLNTKHVKTFAELTGDYIPLQLDESFISKTKFKKLVVQDGLTTGLLHELVAIDMTGSGYSFLKPKLEVHCSCFYR